jgi:putative two-component system response regulator
MEQGSVRAQIEKGKRTQFDPRFADIMIAMIDEDAEYRMREL